MNNNDYSMWTMRTYLSAAAAAGISLSEWPSVTPRENLFFESSIKMHGFMHF